MENCIFCKIVQGEINANFVYRDGEIVVFRDIKPKAKHHILVVPVEHVESLLDLQDKHFSLLTKMIKVIQQLVKEHKLDSAYKLMVNGGKYQEVPHLHLHLLAD
jgi:histidine triad (HIT) family protein